MNTFYLSIDASRLAFFFNSAIILPAAYITNKYSDVQSFYEGHLVFSKEKWVGSCTCYLEVVLTTAESKQLQEIKPYTTHLFLYNGVLPISRISKICIEKEVESIVYNIIKTTAFLPDIISIENKQVIDIGLFSNKSIEYNNIEGKIQNFNSILGGVSLLKSSINFLNINLLDYIVFLSHFNLYIKKQVDSIQTTKQDKYKIIKEKEKEIQSYIFSKKGIDKSIFDTLAKKNKTIYKQDYTGILINSIDINNDLYDIAFLVNYGKDSRLTIDGFMSELLAGKFPKEKTEDVCLILGLHIGYSSFRHEYKQSNEYVKTKFSLDSQLDYYAIESVFQFVFNDNKDAGIFDYIDSWCPKLSIEEKQGYDTYRILDTVVLEKKKKTIQEILEDGLHVFSKSYSAISSNLSDIVSSWIPLSTSPITSNVDKIKVANLFSAKLEELFAAHLLDFRNTIEEFVQSKLTAKDDEITALKASYEQAIEKLKAKKEELSEMVDKADFELERVIEENNKLKTRILEVESKSISVEEHIDELNSLDNEVNGSDEDLTPLPSQKGDLFNSNNNFEQEIKESPNSKEEVKSNTSELPAKNRKNSNKKNNSNK